MLSQGEIYALEYESSRVYSDPGEIAQYRAKARDTPTMLSRTQLGIILANSDSLKNVNEGVQLLTEVIHNSPMNEYYISCLMHLAQGYYTLKKYDLARQYIEQLYRIQPDSQQFKALHRAVVYRNNEQEEEKRATNQQAVIGAVGIAAAIGIGMFAFMKRKK